MTTPPATVFVVDDDPSVRRAMERLMRAAGLEVRTYGSAQEYLDGFDPQAAGCLLLDLAMPGIGGLELQRRLVSRGGAPPIVFLSGQADVPASLQGMDGGGVEFLTKPVDAATLMHAVRAALDRDRAARIRTS